MENNIDLKDLEAYFKSKKNIRSCGGSHYFINFIQDYVPRYIREINDAVDKGDMVTASSLKNSLLVYKKYIDEAEIFNVSREVWIDEVRVLPD